MEILQALRDGKIHMAILINALAFGYGHAQGWIVPGPVAEIYISAIGQYHVRGTYRFRIGARRATLEVYPTVGWQASLLA